MRTGLDGTSRSAAAVSIARSSEYGMSFTLLACETPPSSYEAEPAVRVGRSVNSNTRTRMPRACIGGSIEVRHKLRAIVKSNCLLNG